MVEPFGETQGKHVPVMLDEVLDYLEVKPGKKYIDTTVGGGGHTEAILLAGGEVLGIDQDPNSLERAKQRLLSRPPVGETRQACPGRYSTVPPPQRRFKLVRGNFANLRKIASENDFLPVDGILMDLGFASFQIEDPRYGLSFMHEGPLDMRLDPNLGVTARDLLNTWPAGALEELFRKFGDEPKAREIARRIVKRRESEAFETTTQFADLVESVVKGRGKIHPATRVFQALRMAVNAELENLQSALPQAFELLKNGGRLVVISFHSGEDRIVKNYFRSLEQQGEATILTKKPVLPSIEEININQRARSAKLRSILKHVQETEPDQE